MNSIITEARFFSPSKAVTLRLYAQAQKQQKTMVVVAQLVEHSVVVRDVAGSSPVDHPNF